MSTTSPTGRPDRPLPPTLAHQTDAQTWAEGQDVLFTLPANTFTDPMGLSLRYSATLASGQALPSWLVFNASNETFTGMAPSAAASMAIKVTAADSNGLSVSETIQVNVAAAPKLLGTILGMNLNANMAFTQALPVGIFSNPQHQTLHYTAALADGQALPTWLTFNSTGNLSFSGKAPVTVGAVTIKVTATDTSGLSTSATFTDNVGAQAPTVNGLANNQMWTVGNAVSFNAGGTFADPQKEVLHFAAALSTGQSLPTWLTFNTATGAFAGTAPITPQTLGIRVTATNASGVSTSEMIEAIVRGAPPTLAHQTPNQTWAADHAISFLLPANTFSAPQTTALIYSAAEISGTDQTAWLHFNSATGLFSGTVPHAASGVIGISVAATDAHFVSATETFGVALGATSATAIPSTFAATEHLPLHFV